MRVCNVCVCLWSYNINKSSSSISSSNSSYVNSSSSSVLNDILKPKSSEIKNII